MHELSATEASALREEVLADIKQSIDLANFAVTAGMAVIGYGLSQRNALVALLPLAILAAARREVTNRRANVLRISTYLQVFAGQMFGYEARLARLRRRQRDSPVPGWSVSPLGTFRLLTYAGHLCVVASVVVFFTGDVTKRFAVARGFSDVFDLIASASVILAAIIVWQYLTRGESRRLKFIVEHGTLEEELVKRWQAIGNDEAIAPGSQRVTTGGPARRPK